MVASSTSTPVPRLPTSTTAATPTSTSTRSGPGTRGSGSTSRSSNGSASALRSSTSTPRATSIRISARARSIRSPWSPSSARPSASSLLHCGPPCTGGPRSPPMWWMPRHFVVLSVLAACAALSSLAAAAPKTDIVVLNNGDHITGEVKSLEQGRLKFSTDNIGTIYIEWEDIASLSAVRIFEVQTTDGSLYHGSLEIGPEAGTFILNDGVQPRTMRFEELIRIVPVSQGRLEGIDGSVNLGMSYVRATELGQLSLSGNAVQRHSEIEKELNLALTLTREPDQQDTSRYSAVITRRSFMAHRKYWWVNGGVFSNSEIGVDLRALVGIGLGMSFVQTYHSQFMGFAGLAVGRE